MVTFELAYRSKTGDTELWHLKGVEWFDAPAPPHRHRCKIQTQGYINYFTFIARCACGAISSDGKHWDERNSR